MAQDLRDLFKKTRTSHRPNMKKGHEARFLVRLDKELPKRKTNRFLTLRIAASFLVMLGLGVIFTKWYQTPESSGAKSVPKIEKVATPISLGDLSPDLKKVETYYLTNINFELIQLRLDEDNTELVNGYMERLSELNDEYKLLNGELNRLGPNDQTVSAQIKNLQLRLQLLYKLKEKLNEIKSFDNEEVEPHNI